MDFSMMMLVTLRGFVSPCKNGGSQLSKNGTRLPYETAGFFKNSWHMSRQLCSFASEVTFRKMVCVLRVFSSQYCSPSDIAKLHIIEFPL